MTTLAPTTRLRVARDAYLEENGFSTDAYTAKWAHGKFGPLYFVIPSTRTRREAIRYHDLHHVLTGYRATPVGEAEIGAWEVATGCKRLWAGWVLNLLAMTMGIVIAPARTFRAFVRGRHSENLYAREFNDALLEREVRDMRIELGLNQEEQQPTTRDRLLYALWVAVGIGLYAMAALTVLVPLAALIWVLL